MSALKQVFAVVASIALVVGVNALLPGIGTLVGSAFLASMIGAGIIAVGLLLIQTIFMPGKSGNNSGTNMEAGKLTVRVPEGPRWLVSGTYRQGGNVLFAEFDGSGDLWFVVVHCDSIGVGPYQYYLDDVAITLSGSGVQTKDFRLLDNEEKDLADTDGAGDTYIDIWTTTHTESDPTPPAISALASALPSKWTADHKLVGTTYSVVRMRGLEIEHRFKIYKWRGPLGLGEPALSVVPASWSNMYDPRDVTQTLGDRTTYQPSKNAALVWAWFRTHPYGRKKSEDSINWDKIAEQADICDDSVVGVESTQPRYECSIAIPENKQRIVAEQEILMAMDGQIAFDDEGKSWVRAGHYYEPTLSISRNRDVIAMESVEAQDGESETQGVIVRYIDPASGYQAQPSAAWLNPIYYVEGETPQFLTVDILACQNHNQAMRLAKGIGLRSQPRHKIAPTVGLRGLRARNERIFDLQYDNTFAGNYEIATQVEVDATGIFCGFGAVPIDPDRWTLLAGEEKPAPVVDVGAGAGTPVPPGGFGNEPTFITGGPGKGRLLVDYTRASPRRDSIVDFQFASVSDAALGKWRNMEIDRTANQARSDVITENADYSIRYRTRLTSGAVTDWETLDDISAQSYASVEQTETSLRSKSWVQGTNVLTAATANTVLTGIGAGADGLDSTGAFAGYLGKIFYGKYASSGTAIGGLTSGNHYWFVIFSNDRIKAYPTEADAIATTNIIDITGTFPAGTHTVTSATITIGNHKRVFDKDVTLAITGGVRKFRDLGGYYGIYYDDAGWFDTTTLTLAVGANTAPTYTATKLIADAQFTKATNRFFVGTITTPVAGAGGTGGGVGGPPGFSGDGPIP